MREYRPYILPDGTEIPGHWYERPERFVATEYGWAKLREWGAQVITWCMDGNDHYGQEFHHVYGRGGGKRDDRLAYLRWLCRTHHNETPILHQELRVAESGEP